MPSDDQPFLDYYDVLQVHPDCDAKFLEAAYHHLAKLHHPDHSQTADTTRFNELTEAYRVLRDPGRRAEYDRLHARQRKRQASRAKAKGKPVEEPVADDLTAADDADDHSRILLYLYKKRRENAQKAGVIAFYLQEMLGCSDDEFEFHKWYLKEKGFIAITEQGTIAITIQGVDHVIATQVETKARKYLSGPASAPPA